MDFCCRMWLGHILCATHQTNTRGSMLHLLLYAFFWVISGVWIQTPHLNSDAGELPGRKHTTFRTWQKFEIKNMLHLDKTCYTDSHIQTQHEWWRVEITPTIWWESYHQSSLNPLNANLYSICHFLALLGAHPILHVSRIRVKTSQSTSYLWYV